MKKNVSKELKVALYALVKRYRSDSVLRMESLKEYSRNHSFQVVTERMDHVLSSSGDPDDVSGFRDLLSLLVNRKIDAILSWNPVGNFKCLVRSTELSAFQLAASQEVGLPTDSKKPRVSS